MSQNHCRREEMKSVYLPNVELKPVHLPNNDRRCSREEQADFIRTLKVGEEVSGITGEVTDRGNYPVEISDGNGVQVRASLPYGELLPGCMEPREGAMVKAVVKMTHPEQGIVILSLKRHAAKQLCQDKAVVPVLLTRAARRAADGSHAGFQGFALGKQGKGLRVFLPGSQEAFSGPRLCQGLAVNCQVINLNELTGELIVSERAVVEDDDGRSDD